MIEIIEDQNVKVVKFVENVSRLNLPVAQSVKADIQKVFSSEKENVVISLKGIHFIDSSGFALLISALKASRSNNCTLKLSDINQEVMELVKLMQLHNIFDIYPDVNEAIKSF
jgi:anti-sigma B factor antagonist